MGSREAWTLCNLHFSTVNHRVPMLASRSQGERLIGRRLPQAALPLSRRSHNWACRDPRSKEEDTRYNLGSSGSTKTLTTRLISTTEYHPLRGAKPACEESRWERSRWERSTGRAGRIWSQW